MSMSDPPRADASAPIESGIASNGRQSLGSGRKETIKTRGEPSGRCEPISMILILRKMLHFSMDSMRLLLRITHSGSQTLKGS